MIVGSKSSPENNGKTVRVLRVAEFEERPGERAPEVELQAQQRRVLLTSVDDGDGSRKLWLVEPVRGLLQWRSQRGLVDVDCAKRSYREKFLIRLDDDEAPKAVTRTVYKRKPVDEVI